MTTADQPCCIACERDSDLSGFAEQFIWPCVGRISGVFGSQRILNGEARQPHYGVDVAVPTGTPAKIKERLRIATEKALKSPDVMESMKAGGFEPGIMTVPEIDAYIQTEIKRWGEVIRAAGINPQ